MFDGNKIRYKLYTEIKGSARGKDAIIQCGREVSIDHIDANGMSHVYVNMTNCMIDDWTDHTVAVPTTSIIAAGKVIS